MRHFAAHTVERRPLFSTWEEGLHLWRCLATAIPGAILCIMPDHLHVMGPERIAPKIHGAMSSHTRWMNHRLGVQGPLWRPLSDTGEVIGKKKIDRNIRYIHLNPCRAGLIEDPLSWPLSTHRDLVGLTLQPAAAPHRDPVGLHRYVSADPTVNVEGTPLPYGSTQPPTLDSVVAAVSALTRCTSEELRRRSPQRTLLIRAARSLTDLTQARIAEQLGVSVATVERAEPMNAGEGRTIDRVLFDHRFALMIDEDGPNRPWARWRG
ncbi:MAG: hypothetical protein EA397_04335 [Deltaproteobacteria bacterium]|nr:MAG: hypothetical protein EA397_04335 [Deltaproteobacteria bacterium]